MKFSKLFYKIVEFEFIAGIFIIMNVTLLQWQFYAGTIFVVGLSVINWQQGCDDGVEMVMDIWKEEWKKALNKMKEL